MRIASTKISRWYRMMRATRNRKAARARGNTRAPPRGLLKAMSVRSDFGRRIYSAEGLSKPMRRVQSTEVFSRFTNGTDADGNADWDDADYATDKSGKSSKSLQHRATRKMMKTLGLKKLRDRSESIGGGSKSSSKKKKVLHKAKVARLTQEMGNGGRPEGSDTASMSVTEIDDESAQSPAHSTDTLASKAKKPLSEWAKGKGGEAYAAMITADNLGDVAIVEQCYVMIGGRADDQSILHNAEPEQRPMVNEVLASIGQYLEEDYIDGCRKLDAFCLKNMMGYQVSPFAWICQAIKAVCLQKKQNNNGGQK